MAVKENYKIVFDKFQSSEPVDVTSEFGVITTLSEGKDTKLNAYNTWSLDQVRVAETIKPLNEEEVEAAKDAYHEVAVNHVGSLIKSAIENPDIVADYSIFEGNDANKPILTILNSDSYIEFLKNLEENNKAQFYTPLTDGIKEMDGKLWGVVESGISGNKVGIFGEHKTLFTTSDTEVDWDYSKCAGYTLNISGPEGEALDSGKIASKSRVEVQGGRYKNFEVDNDGCSSTYYNFLFRGPFQADNITIKNVYQPESRVVNFRNNTDVPAIVKGIEYDDGNTKPLVIVRDATGPVELENLDVRFSSSKENIEAGLKLKDCTVKGTSGNYLETIGAEADNVVVVFKEKADSGNVDTAFYADRTNFVDGTLRIRGTLAHSMTGSDLHFREQNPTIRKAFVQDSKIENYNDKNLSVEDPMPNLEVYVCDYANFRSSDAKAKSILYNDHIKKVIINQSSISASVKDSSIIKYWREEFVNQMPAEVIPIEFEWNEEGIYDIEIPLREEHSPLFNTDSEYFSDMERTFGPALIFSKEFVWVNKPNSYTTNTLGKVSFDLGGARNDIPQANITYNRESDSVTVHFELSAANNEIVKTSTTDYIALRYSYKFGDIEIDGGYTGRNPLYEMRFTANQKIPTDIQYRIIEE